MEETGQEELAVKKTTQDRKDVKRETMSEPFWFVIG